VVREGAKGVKDGGVPFRRKILELQARVHFFLWGGRGLSCFRWRSPNPFFSSSLPQALSRAKADVEAHEAALADAAGPKFMTRDEFKQYGATLREKTHVYKRMKQELGDARAELVRV
jgi:hypothetical protein